jgi:DNA-binding CsgD family transcriptional regulator
VIQPPRSAALVRPAARAQELGHVPSWRRIQMLDALTASERRAAQLAADGMTNKEIAQTLFVTIKTVEVHLSHAYCKLEITSRSELDTALLTPARRPLPPSRSPPVGSSRACPYECVRVRGRSRRRLSRQAIGAVVVSQIRGRTRLKRGRHPTMTGGDRNVGSPRRPGCGSEKDDGPV